MRVEDIRVFQMRTSEQMIPISRCHNTMLEYIIERNHLEIDIIGDEISLYIFLDGDKVMMSTFIHLELGLHSEISRVNQLLQHYGFFVSVR